ncbi:MAG: hypothetical protein WA146_12775 [Thiobacillus sp.]|nr:hypothetical protein [Thiobacillus sp.]MDO9385483.1 hypothetical protein [Thiobacillus sp.]
MKNIFEITKRSAVLILLGLILFAAWSPKMDAPAMEQVDAGLKRAFVTFATARAFNAAISVAQGTEVSLSFGAGVTLSVGEVLDPINDLVEQFSNFMLLATVAFGVQKVLLMMGQFEYVKVLLTAILVISGIVYFSGKTSPRWLNTFFILVLMVRFAIPLVTIGTDVIYKQFLEKDFNTSLAAIDSATGTVKQLMPNTGEQIKKNQGWFEKTKDQVTSTFDPRPHIEKLKQSADQAAERIVHIIVVFLLQTLLVPVFLLWALYFVIRNMINHPVRQKE